MRTRILIFHPALPPYRIDTFNEIGQLYDAKLILLHRNLISQAYDQKRLTEQLSLPYSYLVKGFRLFNKTFRTGILSEIRNFKPSIVIAPEYSPTSLVILLFRMLGRKYKVVVWTDDNPESVKHESVFRKITRHFVVNHVDGLILVSEPALDIYRNYSTPKCVAPILQKESVFRERLRDNLHLARRFALEHNLFGKKILLYVGRLSQEKRVDRLLEYFKKILEVQPLCHLVIIGDGPLRISLGEIVERFNIANHVHFGGHCEGSELLAWYSVGQIFFLMSDYEQFGAVVNEALISGMPVICSDAAGAKILIKDGCNGYAVDASDTQSTINASLKVINNIQPLTINSLEHVRPNLMVIEFSDSVNGWRNLLDHLALPNIS